VNRVGWGEEEQGRERRQAREAEKAELGQGTIGKGYEQEMAYAAGRL